MSSSTSERETDLYKLQKEARGIKKQLKTTHIEAEDEGVVIVVNGEQEVVKVTIDENRLSDVKKLEKSIEKCLNKAIKKSQQIGAEMMKGVMGEMNIPGLGGK